MSENPKVGRAIEVFNVLVEGILRETEEEKVAVIDGSCMMRPRLFSKYGPDECRGVQESVRDAKVVFSRIMRLSMGKADEEDWQNYLVAEAIEGLENEKYYGAPDDPEPYAHNCVLNEIIKIIPDFVKGLDI